MVLFLVLYVRKGKQLLDRYILINTHISVNSSRQEVFPLVAIGGGERRGGRFFHDFGTTDQFCDIDQFLSSGKSFYN